MNWKKWLLMAGSIVFTSATVAYAIELNSKIDSDWGKWYCYKIFIKNNAWNPINNWKVKLNIGNTNITSKRNGKFECSNWNCVIDWPNWAEPLKPGQELEIGFCWNGSDRPNKPSLILPNTTTLEVSTSSSNVNLNKTDDNENKSKSNETQIKHSENTSNSNYSTPKYGGWKYIPPFIVKNWKIYDKNGKEVKLFGVNWFGFETPNYTVHGLWSRNYLDMIKQMKKLGFNAVRLPFCPWTLHWKTPTWIDFSKNPDLKGLNSLQLFDKIINALTSNGMYVLLDDHRPDCNAISETPEVPGYTLNDWINDLVFVAKRYKNNPYVIWIDLKNEPHGKERWGNGDIKTDWKLQVEKASKAILNANPNLLIFVEGIEINHNPYTGKWPKCESNENHWWGGNIEPIECYPLNVPKNKLVLSPHVYWPSVYMQPYFKAPDFPDNMPKIWEQQIWRFVWMYPIVPGEFGGKYVGLDKIWQKALINWFIKKHICSFFFWSWNPNSGDTGGILKDDWTSINQDKYENLKRLMDYCSSGKANIDNISRSTSSKKSNTINKTYTKTTSKNNEASNNTSDIVSALNQLVSSVKIDNNIKSKIESLSMSLKKYQHSILNQYYPIFVKFFNDKKQFILSNPKYITDDNYLALSSFITYTQWLFNDLDSNNISNISGYLDSYKKIIQRLKSLK